MTRTARLVLALILPILCLAGYTGWHGWIAAQGQKVTLPIRGFDPRDLLSGHYLIYEVDYGLKSLCAKPGQEKRERFYLCLDPKRIHSASPRCRIVGNICKGVARERGSAPGSSGSISRRAMRENWRRRS